MKIQQGDELQWERGLEHRGGMFHFRRLMEGEPGTIDNFQLSMGRVGGDFYSPRHHHNFEQVRFQLEGELDFARDGKMKTGMVGYFPEGMFYGPQSQDPTATASTIVLQMGGASGSGYLARNEVKAGMDALKAEGASLLPYLALVVLVGAIIPACRRFERRWNRLSEQQAHDPAMAAYFRRDRLMLWLLAIGLPCALTALFKGLAFAFS